MALDNPRIHDNQQRLSGPGYQHRQPDDSSRSPLSGIDQVDAYQVEPTPADGRFRNDVHAHPHCSRAGEGGLGALAGFAAVPISANSRSLSNHTNLSLKPGKFAFKPLGFGSTNTRAP